MRFFFDNNLAPKLAKSLHILVEPEHQVVHLKDRFAANTPDETWIAALSREKEWVIISGDLRIRTHPHEVKAWKTAGHAMFFLKAGWIDLPFWVQAWKFVKCFPEIIALAEKARTGESFFVTVNGKTPTVPARGPAPREAIAAQFDFEFDSDSAARGAGKATDCQQGKQLPRSCARV